MKRNTRIMLEVEETTVVRHEAKTATAVCPPCFLLVVLLRMETTTVLSGLSESEKEQKFRPGIKKYDEQIH
jgi:hypothetical protein